MIGLTSLAAGGAACGCDAGADVGAAAGLPADVAAGLLGAGGDLPAAAASASSTVTNLGRRRRPSLGHWRSYNACLRGHDTLSDAG